MRAARYHGPGDIRVEEVPKPEIEAPTDGIPEGYRAMDEREAVKVLVEL